MSNSCASFEPPRHDPSVWERVWNREVSANQDDHVLARERNGPRWAIVRGAVEANFGSFRGLRCVELGSGRGDFSVLMAEAGARVTLMDYSASALDSAKRRFERLGLAAEFEHGDFLAHSSTLTETFHVAASLGVIEHFRGADRLRTVRAHERVLRPGGLAVISVPNASCPPYRLWKLYLECRGWWPYGMEIPYSRGELHRLCLQAGLERVELHSAGFWQSVADHWVKRLASWAPDWSGSRSMLDAWMGLILLAVARKPGRCRVRDEVRSA